MEQMIASLLRRFEEGKMNRRQLVQSLAAAAGAVSVGQVPAYGASVGATKINHISYRVADYAKTRDFYSGLLGMKVKSDNGKTACGLSIGDLEIHVNGSKDPLHDVGGVSIPLHTPYVDHIDYDTDSSREALAAELTRRGMKSQTKGGSFRIKDPDGFDVTLNSKK
jgi:catechol 2,3-dioxygenase-like lactoylglutathione lyase family enzyme